MGAPHFKERSCPAIPLPPHLGYWTKFVKSSGSSVTASARNKLMYSGSEDTFSTNDRRHPQELGAPELSAFLSALAVQGKVSASTQNQALNAILFLYREVLKITLAWLEGVQRARKPQHLPVVLTRDEVKRVLARLNGTVWLMAAVTYGAGLRLLECLRLRIKDLEFSRGEILVRDGKGQKDRITMLPQNLIDPLRTHLAKVRQLHEQDLAEGFGRVHLPFALDRKYPNAEREWGWQ
jgi:integrase